MINTEQLSSIPESNRGKKEILDVVEEGSEIARGAAERRGDIRSEFTEQVLDGIKEVANQLEEDVTPTFADMHAIAILIGEIFSDSPQKQARINVEKLSLVLNQIRMLNLTSKKKFP